MHIVRTRARTAALLVTGVVAAALAAGPTGPASSLAEPTTTQLIEPGSTVLVVVASPGNLTLGDEAVLDRFVGLGLTPTLADDRTVQAADATGHAFVYVAQSVKHWFDAVRGIGSAPVPLWVTDAQLFDDYGLTGPVLRTDYGNRRTNEIRIVDPTHPMAAGHSGTVTLQADGDKVSWGLPTTSATTVAMVGPKVAAFAVAAGDPLDSGAPAPACRLTFPVSDIGVRTFTPAAWDMFDATASWLAGGCDAPPPVDPPGDTIEHVVAISVDGFHPDAIAALGTSRAPTIHRLLAQGASTLNARSMVELTRTLPNHTSQVTGRRIALPLGHGVTFNTDNGSTVHEAAGHYIASAFDVVHDAGGSTVMYAGKDKFDVLDRSWNGVNGAPDVTGPDNGRDKIDVYVRHWDSGHLTELLNARLAADPASFSFLHFDDPDREGHRNGWMSPEYLTAMSEVDAWIGDVLDTVAGDPQLAASTVVIVTADHGGDGTSHTNSSLPDNYTIPFFVWGAGVSPGANLYALNPDRLDPGTSQPSYAAAVPPVRNGAVANMVTDLLELGPVPGSEINADQSLDRGTP